MRDLKSQASILMLIISAITIPACRNNEGAVSTEPTPLPSGEEIVNRFRQLEGCQSVRLTIKARVTQEDGTAQHATIMTYRKCVDGTQYSLRQLIVSKKDPARGLLSIERPGQPAETVSYLPGFDKFVEVSSLKHEDTLLGLSLQESLGGYDLYTYHVLGTEVINGHDTYQVEGKLKPGSDSSFPRTLAYYRQDNGLPLRMELYNLKDQLIRVRDYTEWAQIDGYWTALRTEIDNLKHKKRIVFDIAEADYKTDLPLSFFSRDNLKKVITHKL